MGYEFELKILEVKIDRLEELIRTMELNKSRQDKIVSLPEWIPLEQAAAQKGGCALPTYKSKLFLQPCAGTNSRLVGGRKCWRKEDVLEWLSVTDSQLKEYADRYGITLPANYQERSA